MIERIYVHNYRCFESFTLDLKGRGSALIIGKNGSGKSTLRHALGVFQKICRGPNRVKEWIDSSDFTQNRTDLPMRFELDLVLTNRRFQYAIAFEYHEDLREATVLEEKLSVDGKVVFSRQLTQVFFSNGPAFFLDLNVGALPIINDKPVDGSIQQLKAFLASMIILSPVPAEMSGFAEEESFELQENASNFAAWLNAVLIRYPAKYNDIAKYLRYVIADFASFEFVPRGERGKQLRVEFENMGPGTGGPDFKVDFKKLSDGEKCYFLSALIVATNRPDRPLFCFWDEPDNHLSLPELGHFITQLRKMTNQNGQFIATSHNPEAIRRFSDETTLVMTRKSHLEPTVVRSLADLQYSGDLIAALKRDEVIG